MGIKKELQIREKKQTELAGCHSKAENLIHNRSYEKKRTPKKKNSIKESVEETSDRLEEILRNAEELPSHTSIMRSLYKSKNGSKKQKHRCSSQKRKR